MVEDHVRHSDTRHEAGKTVVDQHIEFMDETDEGLSDLMGAGSCMEPGLLLDNLSKQDPIKGVSTKKFSTSVKSKIRFCL